MRRPKVKLDNLIAFMTVATKRNVDDAADELGLSPSGVRKQLENVEDSLGIRLFENKRGNLSLTEDGESFYEDARKAVDQILLAEEQVYARKAIRSHHLLIGHSTNLPPKLIAAITQIHIEDTQLVHIEHKSSLTSTTVRRVIEGSLHAGFGILPVRAPELLVRTICEELHRTDSHANAEDDAGDGLLGLTLAVGEHQPADNDGDQRQRVRNGAGEGGLRTVTALSHGSLVLWAYTGSAARKSREGVSHLRQCLSTAGGRGRFM
jgi:DNA-binding transcriptional LysR family regulator